MVKVLRITKVSLAAFVAIILGFGGYIAWSFYYGVAVERTTFSPATWKEKANVYEHSSDPGCVRGGMAIDIIATNLLQGKSFTDVTLLLGEPDVTKEAKVYYELGQCSGYGWHNSVLLVSFQDNQQVSSTAILRD